ncbi:hypothetical protein [Nocardia vulneris]|uniref:Uncharacterized protein n=1 Tax=Nocardia vulneris TaxID=1141657 RepID=A0ABR4Z7U9_9NOCA|nr:hypothetical protein [Nocardia vulneris]KIA61359.1 hypothetical protein FG87_31160 [Nocardia vulneris]
MPTVMLDHPGWNRSEDGRAHRVLTDNHHRISIVTAEDLPQTLFINCQPADARPVPITVGYFDPATLTGPLTLTAPLRALGTVTRLANPDLWDALGAALLGQFLTPKHLQRFYYRLCCTYGRRIHTPDGNTGWLFPRPDVIAALGREDVTDLLVRVKLPALQLAADAYLRHGEQWRELLGSGAPAVKLVEAITKVMPQLDRTAIARAVADHSNDFTVYPIDTTLRSSVCRLSTRHSWPVDDADFHTEWQAMTGEQQSVWTLLALAAGTDCCVRTPTPAVTESAEG